LIEVSRFSKRSLLQPFRSLCLFCPEGLFCQGAVVSSAAPRACSFCHCWIAAAAASPAGRRVSAPSLHHVPTIRFGCIIMHSYSIKKRFLKKRCADGRPISRIAEHKNGAAGYRFIGNLRFLKYNLEPERQINSAAEMYFQSCRGCCCNILSGL
jgi:hypothetical protein